MNKTKFISDICSNHNQNKSRIYELIKAAHSLQCDAVKFQLFSAEKLYSPEFSKKRCNLYKQELPVNWVPYIRKICDDFHLQFHCTIFELEKLHNILNYVDALKIASSEILNLKLIDACAKTGKPLYISTGGATNDEIKAAYNVAFPHTCYFKNLTFYACTPEYPATLDKICIYLYNLHVLCQDTMLGWSDHSVKESVVLSAIMQGVHTIEFHMDLNNMRGSESHYGHCWPTNKIKNLIKIIKEMQRIPFSQIDIEKTFSEMRKWRTDPEDGMRPLKRYRTELKDE